MLYDAIAEQRPFLRQLAEFEHSSEERTSRQWIVRPGSCYFDDPSSANEQLHGWQLGVDIPGLQLAKEEKLRGIGVCATGQGSVYSQSTARTIAKRDQQPSIRPRVTFMRLFAAEAILQPLQRL